ncbi:MAG TPA: hypothetical protein VJN62_09185 [Gemmatimonadales bacterium]|nr:hypothetical protein [Gemmatimonadales bacterium]
MKRGWVVFDDGKVEEIPAFLVDHEEILWPPIMPEKKPGQPATYFRPSDLYRRYEVVPDEAYAFAKDSRKVPQGVFEWIQTQMKKP